MTTSFQQPAGRLHSVISLDTLEMRLTDPRRSFAARLASIDHAAACATQDGDTARAEALATMRRTFIRQNPGGAASLN